MAAPMRDSPLDGATHGSTAAKAPTKAKQGTAQGGSSEPTATTTTSTNFEYDDNEWDVGIGDLIIDLDADIEKTNEKSVPGPGTGSGAVAGSGGGGGGGGVAPAAAQTTPTPAAMAAAGKTGKLAVEHSATVDKGLKMKIKRTKPGTKTSEAKHEIVKPGEQLNGAAPGAGNGNDPLAAGGGNAAPPLHAPPALNANMNSVNSCASGAVASGKRGSSSHRRDKKHAEKSSPGIVKTPAGPTPGSTPAGPGPLPPPPVATPPMVATVPGPGPVVVPPSQPVATPVQNSDVNGLVRTPVQRVVFPVAVSGPGPPVSPNAPGPPASAPPPLPASPSAKDAPKGVPAAPVPAASPAALVNSTAASSASLPHDDSPAPPTVPPSSPSPPLIKKIKTAPVDPKDMLDVCVGTSVGTITEPDCLGPCEPGTSVNLEGIVWHETEGVLVVNVTWRGKTYVGTLLDCTRHDWAPPRFCDSPTSDLDARTPKGRGKRGRGSSNSNSGNDLSNFTETRSSVHSKLRSNSSTNNNGNNKTSSGRRGPPASSPTPFVPPRPDSGTKRKNRCEEEQQQSPVNGKKTKPAPGASSSSSTSLPPPPSPATPVTSNGSGSPPPTSPVLLECPEPNCSKKYKNINGLKYHQSHAHGGSTDENEDKEMTSLSENEEVPSPPESLVPNKCDISNSSTKKDEPMMVDPPPPVATPVAPATAAPEPMVSTVPVLATPPGPAQIVPPQPEKVVPPERILPSDAEMTSDPTLIKQSAGVLRFGLTDESAKTATVLSVPSPNQRPVSPVNKVPQFKVKPTSALMPEADKKDRNNVKILQQQKKKSKKSPTSSPHLNVMEPNFMEQSSGREDVQSPAYSDISDDTAPVLEAETDNKSKVINCEKKSESGTAQSPHSLQHYVFPYYGNPPYLVPSVQTDNKGKELEKTIPETKPVSNLDKEKKETNVGTEYPPKLLEPHFYPYGYVPGYQYGNMGSYPVGMVAGEKDCKEDNLLKSPSPAEQNLKQAPPAHITSLPPKIKTESGKLPEKPPTQQNENHQILKESIEIKNQMPPAFIYPRQQSNQPGQPQAQPQPQQVVQQQQQQQEDLRRYYLFSGDQRPRKDSSSEAPMKATPPPVATKQPPQMPLKMKDKYPESEKNSKDTEKIKQEGVKPTMETQGPPPPPTSSYAYIHPSSYMQSPHYGAIPFDPSHSMYRNMNPMLVPGPYGNNPYLHPQLHPQIPRYHAPEDLSRSPSGPKALDLLQHHANQYYSSHKIHELQERAMKSPTPKSVTPGISPSGGGAPNLPQQQTQSQQQQQQVQQQQSPGSITPQPPGGPPPPNKTPTDKDSRSPPPQRHVHTHHHTHVGVGLGYPIVAGHYPAPYGGKPL